jgi:hypothetical protein
MRVQWTLGTPIQLSVRGIRGFFACAVILIFTPITVSFVSGSDPVSAPPHFSPQPLTEESAPPSPRKGEVSPVRALPPPPVGVTDLKFNEFFTLPIGPRGLTLTQKLQSLDGKQVRILGYMVRQGEPYPGLFLLAPLPLRLHDSEYGLADDLPPTTMFIHLPEYKDKIVPYMAGPLLLIGTLNVGNHEEVDGRISIVRLTLDAVPPAIADRLQQATLAPQPQTIHR